MVHVTRNMIMMYLIKRPDSRKIRRKDQIHTKMSPQKVFSYPPDPQQREVEWNLHCFKYSNPTLQAIQVRNDYGGD